MFCKRLALVPREIARAERAAPAPDSMIADQFARQDMVFDPRCSQPSSSKCFGELI
jgi:hypothetical protein